MSVESASYINQLDSTRPTSSDLKSEGDNHLRLLKVVLQNTLPNIAGAVTATHTQLNYVTGVTSAIQTQLDAKAPLASPALTGTPTVPTAATATTTTQAASTAFVHNVLDSLGDATLAAAEAQADIATTQAGIATTQAGLATTNGAAQVTLAAAQVTLATTQAGIATTQAGISTTQAGNAAASAVAADASADAAAASAVAADASADAAAASAASIAGGPVTSVNGMTGVVTGLATASDITAERSATATLTNKTIALGSNTVSGTLAQFNTAVTDADFASLAGTETLANKTIAGATFTDGYTEETATANTSTAYTVNLTNGSVQFLTLTGNCTYTFPTPAAGKSFLLIQKQDATGSRTVTWPASVKWPGGTAPTITSAASKVDKFVFTAIDGSSWLGSVAGLNYTA